MFACKCPRCKWIRAFQGETVVWLNIWTTIEVRAWEVMWGNKKISCNSIYFAFICYHLAKLDKTSALKWQHENFPRIYTKHALFKIEVIVLWGNQDLQICSLPVVWNPNNSCQQHFFKTAWSFIVWKQGLLQVVRGKLKKSVSSLQITTESEHSDSPVFLSYSWHIGSKSLLLGTNTQRRNV